MGKSLAELADQLKDEVLPTAGQDLDDLPVFGTFTPPPPPGAYRFKLPAGLATAPIWDVFDAADKNPSQRIRVVFDRDHPLLIVQSPGGKSNGEPYETRMTNNERSRGKDKSVVASDLDYLLRATGWQPAPGEKGKPKSNREYMSAVQKQAGKEFSADLRYSWRCSKDRDIRARDGAGQVQVIEGRKGCGASYYQEDVNKDASGAVPYEVTCEQCGALLRAFANVDNMRS